jgi:hypothetical protein
MITLSLLSYKLMHPRDDIDKNQNLWSIFIPFFQKIKDYRLFFVP